MNGGEIKSGPSNLRDRRLGLKTKEMLRRVAVWWKTKDGFHKMKWGEAVLSEWNAIPYIGRHVDSQNRPFRKILEGEISSTKFLQNVVYAVG